jgi:hypothetical protein
MNLKIKSTQSFRYTYRDRVYVRVFIEMSADTCISICVCTIFIKKIFQSNARQISCAHKMNVRRHPKIQRRKRIAVHGWRSDTLPLLPTWFLWGADAACGHARLKSTLTDPSVRSTWVWNSIALVPWNAVRNGNWTGVVKTHPSAHPRHSVRPTLNHICVYIRQVLDHLWVFLEKHNYFNISITCMF